MSVTGQRASYFAWQRMVDVVKVMSYVFPFVIHISLDYKDKKFKLDFTVSYGI